MSTDLLPVIYDEPVEFAVLGGLMESESVRREFFAQILPSDFFSAPNRGLFEAIASRHDRGERVSSEALIADGFDAGLVMDCFKHSLPPRFPAGLATLKRDAARRARLVEINHERERIISDPDCLQAPDTLNSLIADRRFDVDNPPAKPVPVLLIAGKSIATAGNLVAVTAQAKAGKTALLTGMLAALMHPSGDCLGLSSDNADGLAVVHFDTEQSRFDHHAVILQALRRAGLDRPPEWLRSYSLADVPTKDRRKALAHEMSRAAVAGKLCAVFLDGVADLCMDPNDPAEAFGLVEELHRLAITFDCPIICILHENPGSETGKTRGHLGSQLERKAETNLRLSKDPEGITTVFTERSRHCHISKESGPRFAWNDGAGMHVSVESARDQLAGAKAKEATSELGRVFADKSVLTYGELRGAMMRIRGITQRVAEKRIASLQPDFIRQTGSGLYEVRP